MTLRHVASSRVPNRRDRPACGRAASVTTAQRARRADGSRSRLPKVDTRLVVGLLLVALSVLGGLRLAATADDTVAVYTATARSARRITCSLAGDLRPTRIQASDDVLDRLVPAAARRAPGRPGVALPARRGRARRRRASARRRRASKGREITVPIGADHALGGALEPGDRVDVLGSFDKGTEIAKTLTVATAAQVVDVVQRRRALRSARRRADARSRSRSHPDDVVFVAFAVRNGEVDVVRVGRPPAQVRALPLRRLRAPVTRPVRVVTCAGGAPWEAPLVRGLQRQRARHRARAPLRRPRRAARRRAP